MFRSGETVIQIRPSGSHLKLKFIITNLFLSNVIYEPNAVIYKLYVMAPSKDFSSFCVCIM